MLARPLSLPLTFFSDISKQIHQPSSSAVPPLPLVLYVCACVSLCCILTKAALDKPSLPPLNTRLIL